MTFKVTQEIATVR